MASGLAGVSQASEAIHSSFPHSGGEGGGLEKENMHQTLNNPCYKWGNPISWIVGTFGETNNYWSNI